MDLLTYQEEGDTWVRVPTAAQAFGMARESSRPLLLVSANPVAESGELLAFIELFKSAGGAVERLAAASPCPAWTWIRSVRAAGVSRVLLIPGDEGGLGGRLAPGDLVTVPRDVCPALHVRVFDGHPMSVCGARFDRLVLGLRQFRLQCFGHWAGCRWAVAAGVPAPTWPLEVPVHVIGREDDRAGLLRTSGAAHRGEGGSTP